jgi:DNA-directed RNA polymerase specialized sigma24 family protein
MPPIWCKTQGSARSRRWIPFDGDNFKAWFFQILMNCHLNRARTASRRPQTTDLDEAPDHFLYQQAQKLGKRALGIDPAAALLEKSDSQSIAQALLDLPDDFRAVAHALSG